MAEELNGFEHFKSQLFVEGEEYLLTTNNRGLAIDKVSVDRVGPKVQATHQQLVEVVYCAE
jgi:hypothetical protein